VELARQRWSVTAAALEIGENRSHLRNALLGIVTPCDHVRDELPRLLGKSVDELFTPESLAAQYGNGRRLTTSVPVVRRTRAEIARDRAREQEQRKLAGSPR
jgi:hypothetical protein